MSDALEFGGVDGAARVGSKDETISHFSGSELLIDSVMERIHLYI